MIHELRSLQVMSAESRHYYRQLTMVPPSLDALGLCGVCSFLCNATIGCEVGM